MGVHMFDTATFLVAVLDLSPRQRVDHTNLLALRPVNDAFTRLMNHATTGRPEHRRLLQRCPHHVQIRFDVFDEGGATSALRCRRDNETHPSPPGGAANVVNSHTTQPPANAPTIVT